MVKNKAGYSYYRNLFATENVKTLLKDLKYTLKDASKRGNEKLNPTVNDLEFKIAFIQKTQFKAELLAAKKLQKARNKMLPPRKVQLKPIQQEKPAAEIQ
jgi:hypothetical protein